MNVLLRLGLNGALFYLGYSLLYDFGRPDLAYPVMIGTVGVLVWSTRSEKTHDLLRLFVATAVIGTATLFLGKALGKDMILGGYIIVLGAMPYVYHCLLTKRSGESDPHSR